MFVRVVAVLSLLIATSTVLCAPSPKVSVCHATSSETNPFVLVSVSQAGADNHLLNHAGDFLANTNPPPVIGTNCMQYGPDCKPTTALTCNNLGQCCDGTDCSRGTCPTTGGCTSTCPVPWPASYSASSATYSTNPNTWAYLTSRALPGGLPPVFLNSPDTLVTSSTYGALCSNIESQSVSILQGLCVSQGKTFAISYNFVASTTSAFETYIILASSDCAGTALDNTKSIVLIGCNGGTPGTITGGGACTPTLIDMTAGERIVELSQFELVANEEYTVILGISTNNIVTWSLADSNADTIVSFTADLGSSFTFNSLLLMLGRGNGGVTCATSFSLNV